MIKVIKLKKTDEKGILMIPEKQISNSWSTLNIVLIEDGRYVACFDNDFEIIGELEDD